MRAHLLVITIISAVLSVTSASATVVINDDNGGKMEDYTTRFQRVRNSGEAVVIDGKCMSACTMVLGLVPRDQVCVTANAVLGFHAAWQFDNGGHRVASASGTRELMKTYPASIRTWIVRHGGLTPNLMLLSGRDLYAIVPPCDKGRRAQSNLPARSVRTASLAAREEVGGASVASLLKRLP